MSRRFDFGSDRADRIFRLAADLVIGCLVFYGFR